MVQETGLFRRKHSISDFAQRQGANLSICRIANWGGVNSSQVG